MNSVFFKNGSDQNRPIPRLVSRKGDMVGTLCVNKRQASLCSVHLLRIELSILVHSFKVSAQLVACRPRFLPPFSVPRITFWRGFCGK